MSYYIHVAPYILIYKCTWQNICCIIVILSISGTWMKDKYMTGGYDLVCSLVHLPFLLGVKNNNVKDDSCFLFY
jgi:uncharacterized membrane protein